MVEEKVKEILKVIEAEDLDKLTRAKCIRALGRLLAIKVRGAKPSKYEITKEVRKALWFVMRGPVRRDVKDSIELAIFMDAPFESQVLNSTYRLLLERLLKVTVEEIGNLTPMWKMRLLNLMIDCIYNVATTEGRDYVDKIYKALRGGEIVDRVN